MVELCNAPACAIALITSWNKRISFIIKLNPPLKTGFHCSDAAHKFLIAP